MLDAAGVELATIQTILRHKSATTTAKCLHSLRGTRVELHLVFEGEKKLPVGKPRARKFWRLAPNLTPGANAKH